MSERPKILLLVHRTPFPPNRGDRIRSYHLLKHLARRADVYLAALADEPIAPNTLDELRSLCHEMIIEPLSGWRWMRGAMSLASGITATEGLFHSPRFASRLRRWGAEIAFDRVVVFCSSMVQYLDAVNVRPCQTLVDLVDVDSEKCFDYARNGSGVKSWLYRLEGARLRRLECSLRPRAGCVALVSEPEAEIYRRFSGHERIAAIPNGVDLDYYRPANASPIEHRCTFVGAMDYRPNADAARWFCREVWPAVRARFPEATFTIVGRQPGRDVLRLAGHDGVSVTGSVADVRPYVAEASVAVVPLRIARGVQNKVLEAMAMARPVVASPSALTGIGLTPNAHALEAGEPEQWVAALESLFGSPARREELGRAGRRFVETHHRWEACLAPLDRLLGLSECMAPIPTDVSTADATLADAAEVSTHLVSAASP
jgi:polysaccharide biosynthesis protein PslH